MTQRDTALQQLAKTEFDVLILGGGINGAVAAAALSAQGARVGLVDRGDFAAGSSSNSSNLAWGGIKYLESGEWLLVKKLCRSRNHLMDNYPSRVKEIRFYTTINRGFRWPAWVIYLGAVFYWLMGACRTRPPRFLRRRDIEREQPVINAAASAGGVEYSDCYLPGNDARFVFNFIRSAIHNGAVVANYVEALGSVHNASHPPHWITEVRDSENGRRLSLRSKVIINACGAYVDTYNQTVGQVTSHRHVFSKGVHLIVPRLIREEKILAFFASDGRLFFVIPMGQCTCIGTTDTPVESPKVSVTDADRQFILDNANRLLTLDQPLTANDIIAERCGVRPLVVKRGRPAKADWLKLSRKHQIHNNRSAAYLSIFGGKITDCVNVGNEIIDHCESFGVIKAERWQKWYGEPSEERKQRFLLAAAEQRLAEPAAGGAVEAQSATESIAERWWRRFGEQAYELLDIAKNDPSQLQRPIAQQDYSRCEIALMGREECIVHLDDFFRRRTKIVQTMSSQALIDHPGVLEVAQLLFGEAAGEKLAEYRQQFSDQQLMPTVKAAAASGVRF